MKWIVTYIKWIMFVSGVLTLSMVYFAIAPDAALKANFGHSLEGPLAELIVRNWGLLIALIGAMLIYGAFDPPARRLVLTIAGISKAAFVLLMGFVGSQYMRQNVGVAVWIDTFWVLVFVTYLSITWTRKSIPAAVDHSVR